MYVDGHERADVVKDRLRYIAELDTYLSRMDQYGGADMNDVTPRVSEEGEVVLCVHDEVVLHQHDGEGWSYQQVRTLRAIRPPPLLLVISAAKYSRWYSLCAGGGELGA